MRITNSILAKEAITGFQSQMVSLAEARDRASTGLKLQRPSDDPVAAAGVMNSSSSLRALDQYRRNIQAGQSRLDAEESALEHLTNTMTRAKELAASQAGDPATATTRFITKQEVDKLIEFVTNLGNTQINGAYIFGGQYADTAPFQGTATDPLRPPVGASRIEIAAGQLAETTHSAQDVFLDSDVLGSLQALSDALDINDVPGIQNALTRMDTAFDEVQNLVGEVGSRVNQLEVSLNNIESLEINLNTFRSNLQDADLAEAVTQLVARQGTLEAAMAANSNILTLTLTDYLR
ncbi:MAG: flagellar hook-associated protein FlgL [Gemmatimonadota bacterium]|nr:flagellar hook-associated protein FlgL [Gemmatimonadota bacterium]MDH5758246.1 flagellar hook-associated protein FlgL [Gemmatimonadota bacterium]